MIPFIFHYNKPESLKAGKPKISLHFNKKYHLVDNIVVNVKSGGRIRKSQPHFVIAGKAESIEIIDDIAYLN